MFRDSREKQRNQFSLQIKLLKQCIHLQMNDKIMKIILLSQHHIKFSSCYPSYSAFILIKKMNNT